MDNSYKIVVVGCGAIGSATLYQLAQRGVKVLGVDRYHPPHSFGSSHGDSRLTRESIGEGTQYIPLVRRTNQLLRELESRTAEELLVKTGVLMVYDTRAPGDWHGAENFLAQTVNFATEFGIEHEKLSLNELQQRFPQFVYRGFEQGYFEPGGGIIRPETCIRLQNNLAKESGAELLFDCSVEKIDFTASGVELSTSNGKICCDKVILTTGPWISLLLGPEFNKIFKLYRQFFTHFEVSDVEAFSLGTFPSFFWITEKAKLLPYGFPIIGLGNVIKLCVELYDSPTDIERMGEGVSKEESGRIAEIISNYVKGVGRLSAADGCRYTLTANQHFLIDSHPEYPQMLIGSACSGHGFKHSAAVGEALAQLAIGEKPDNDISAFSIASHLNE